MDIVIVRENEEDLYAGIEHQQTEDVVQCLKLISRPGCEKKVRSAFEFAKRHNRKKVLCFTKDNIMKQTDDLFHKVFDEFAKEYPEIENKHWIIDIGAAKMADTQEIFDVLAMSNLYGNVLSDVAAQITGSVGLAGSANIGEECSMFEAIHGSAPRRAGQNVANPSRILQGGIIMLNHIGQTEIAEKVQNAWLKTLEDGINTYDLYMGGTSKQKLGTKEFAKAVIENLGQKPSILKSVSFTNNSALNLPKNNRKPAAKKELVGVDIVAGTKGSNPNELAEKMKRIESNGIKLSMITNRGIKVWPDGFKETFCTAHRTFRFKPLENVEIKKSNIIELLKNAIDENIDSIKTENLYSFDGKAGYSLGQGQ
jgi:isocitrate dehydrogenase